ncbi:MAG: helix-turn-helix domain-containing protein [Prevotella sp.]|nr:helix-turn-helix domain-containing protein [Candidatus Prevotella equi]
MMHVEEISKRWLSNPEAQKYLGVSAEFMKDLREQAKIHWYKRGKTIWYEIKDLDSFVLKGKVV